MPILDKNPEKRLKDLIQGSARVLLINPPVEERRYHWLRWNQPSDLLRLATWMRAKSKKVDVRLYDFMFPDASGGVPKHKVKETWLRPGDRQLWHFGQRYEDFEEQFATWTLNEKWRPDVILITSLTSYWHKSVEKLVNKILNKMRGEKERKRVQICLYGNYPKFEPEHACSQRDVDVVFANTVNTNDCAPDFSLYHDTYKRPPLFYGLNILDTNLGDQLEGAMESETCAARSKGIARPAAVTLAFLNEDICSQGHQWDQVARFVEKYPRRVTVEGIAGVVPKSLTKDMLGMLKLSGVRTLFVEHARTPGGDLDKSAYDALLSVMSNETHSKQSGRSTAAWLDKATVTGFVYMGLPDDTMDGIVRSTLYLNQAFQAVILKPFGYSPSIDTSSAAERAKRWVDGPRGGSPQWFPYSDRTDVAKTGYEDLIRWQNLLNKRVKGATFDFLGGGTVAKLVRETLVMESWKRHREAR